MMDEQLAVTRENIENAHQTVETMETLKEVGIQNEAAVSAARATWLNVAAQEKTLLQHYEENLFDNSRSCGTDDVELHNNRTRNDFFHRFKQQFVEQCAWRSIGPGVVRWNDLRPVGYS